MPTVTISPDGTIVVSTNGSPTPTAPTVGEDTFEKRLRASPLVAFGRAPRGKPQWDEGTLEIAQPTGDPASPQTKLATVLVEKITNGHFVEHWVSVDTDIHSTRTYDAVEVPTTAGTIQDRINAIKAANPGRLLQYATYDMEYHPAPDTSTLPMNPPPGRDIRTYKLFTRQGQNNVESGAVWVDRGPPGSMSRDEHWLFRTDLYVSPNKDATPPITARAVRAPSGAGSNGPPFPPPNLPVSARVFIETWIAAQAGSTAISYAHVTYTWGAVP